MARDRTKANGEGTIYKRGKGYCGQYHVITRDGTKKRRSVYGKTRAEAAEKLAAAIADRDRGLTFDAGNLTVGEHLDRYLEDARARLRPKPFNRAEGLVRNHVKPTLGNVKLKDLSPTHLRGLYAAKLDSGLSGRTVGYIHVTLYGTLKQAVEDGLLPRNPASAVKPPKADKSEMTPLSPTQAKTLLETARAMDDRWSALYFLAVSTGLRQGELLGLGWEDVHLEDAMVRVRHTLQPAGFPKGAPARLTPPKTRRSLRSVHLPHSAVGTLVRQGNFRTRSGPKRTVHGTIAALSSRTRLAGTPTTRTSCPDTSSRSYGRQGSRTYASTTSGTRARRSC